MKNDWKVPVDQVEEGTVLICDSGFSCIPKTNVTRLVKKDKVGFFITCNQGRHYLDGQLDAKCQHYVGFKLKT